MKLLLNWNYLLTKTVHFCLQKSSEVLCIRKDNCWSQCYPVSLLRSGSICRVSLAKPEHSKGSAPHFWDEIRNVLLFFSLMKLIDALVTSWTLICFPPSLEMHFYCIRNLSVVNSSCSKSSVFPHKLMKCSFPEQHTTC